MRLNPCLKGFKPFKLQKNQQMCILLLLNAENLLS